MKEETCVVRELTVSRVENNITNLLILLTVLWKLNGTAIKTWLETFLELKDVFLKFI